MKGQASGLRLVSGKASVSGQAARRSCYEDYLHSLKSLYEQLYEHIHLLTRGALNPTLR